MKLWQRIALGIACTAGVAGVQFNPVSDSLVQAIVRFEGRRLVPYRDSVGVLTVCAGITNAALPGFVIPGKRYSLSTCKTAEKRVLSSTATALSLELPYVRQGMWDALMDFGYNLGVPKLHESTLLRKLKAGDCSGATQEFYRWNRAGGHVLLGLSIRRGWEAGQFQAECQQWLVDRRTGPQWR